jgi:hypothetical protein
MKIFSAQLKGTTTVVSGSTASITGSFTGSIAGIDINATNAFTASTIARLSSIETISSSNDSRVNSLEAFSSSIFTTNTFTSSTSARLNALETTSASVDTLNSNQNTRLNSLEDKTGSLATTGSNTFYGTQTFTGSVYIYENLIVQGSSSLQNITASAVDIGTNKIILNVDNPAVRFAGISVYDSGSTQGTGSLWWDSTQNHWLYEHPSDSAAPYNSAILISGPKNTGNLGEETELVSNFVMKAVGGDHISASAIYDDGTTIKLLSNTEVTGSLKITGSINVGQGRFKEWYTTGTGLALETGVSSNVGNVLTFDRTLSRYYPLQLSGGDGNGGAANYIQITTSGVGIGNAAPYGSLHLTGIYNGAQNTLNLENNWPNNHRTSLINFWAYYNTTNPLAVIEGGQDESATNAGQIVFKTMASGASPAERMRISSDGRVGMGTTNPQALLHLSSTINSLRIDANAGYEIFITGSDSANIYHASPNQAIYLNTNGGQLHFGTSNASTLLTISGSNVGIGIDVPEGILDVYKSNTAGLGGHIILRNNGSAVANETAVLFVDGGIGSVRAAISSTTENSPYFGDIKFKTGATSYGSLNTRMTITGAGNVGIGTTAPNYPLHVYKAGSIATINVGSSAGQNLQLRMEEAGAVKCAITYVPADSSTRFFSNGTDKLTIGSGGNIGLNRVSPLARLSVFGGAFQLMGDWGNHQTIITNAATAGTLDGSLTITVPDMAGAAGSIGYGGYSCEVYVAGFQGLYCHAWFSGYTNNGVTPSETAILRSSGGWSVSQFGTGSQGLVFVIDYPASIIHPTARIIINKGGHSYENEYPANSITKVWT